MRDFQKDLTAAMLHCWANTAYLMFDERAAFRAVVNGKIKGFKPSPRLLDPKTFDMGSLAHIVPEHMSTDNVEMVELWMREHPELLEQFRPFYRPENASLASGWANVLSQ